MDNRFVTTEAMINSEAAGSSLTSSSSDSRSGNSSMNMLHQDTSVISAHDAHKGIYDILSRLPPPPPPASKLHGGLEPLANHSTSIDAVQGYFFRKKMLMQDANETRLWYNMKKSPKSYYY